MSVDLFVTFKMEYFEGLSFQINYNFILKKHRIRYLIINFVDLSQFQSTYLLPRARVDRESSSTWSIH